ncbi:MAG: dihydroorotase, partial [Deltaproteobacteria bacterium]|nr:dihydroorotase [Deltaproteobacteria bacterium]
MKLIIKNGRVIDPVGGIDEQLDILAEDGRICQVAKDIPRPDDAEEIDAAGRIVVPGLIDMHTHLREPGEEYKETILTGAQAAAAGGFTTIACMPNTKPVNDSESVTRFIIEQARRDACVNVLPVASITQGLLGEAITEIGGLKEAGAVALSDDGTTVRSAEVMRRAMEYARTFEMPIICHCEDLDLALGGSIHEGKVATLLGLRGIPAASEEVIIAREILLSELTGHPVHIAHVSTVGSVRIIRQAKANGIQVTAETAPHYFSLTEEAVMGFDTATKVNPPLRSEADRTAIREGLRDGTLDVIASDHAPHSTLEKDVEYDKAAFGMVGLETSLALTLQLVAEKVLTLNQAIEKMTVNPARILRISKGTLAPGVDADITLIDTGVPYTVDRASFRSKSSNSPFLGRHFTGRA